MVSMILIIVAQAHFKQRIHPGLRKHKTLGCEQWILKHLRLDLASVSGGPLSGQVGQRAMARSLELAVRHGDLLEYFVAGCRGLKKVVEG